MTFEIVFPDRQCQKIFTALLSNKLVQFPSLRKKWYSAVQLDDPLNQDENLWEISQAFFGWMVLGLAFPVINFVTHCDCWLPEINGFWVRINEFILACIITKFIGLLCFWVEITISKNVYAMWNTLEKKSIKSAGQNPELVFRVKECASRSFIIGALLESFSNKAQTCSWTCDHLLQEQLFALKAVDHLRQTRPAANGRLDTDAQSAPAFCSQRETGLSIAHFKRHVWIPPPWCTSCSDGLLGGSTGGRD